MIRPAEIVKFSCMVDDITEATFSRIFTALARCYRVLANKLNAKWGGTTLTPFQIFLVLHLAWPRARARWPGEAGIHVLRILDLGRGRRGVDCIARRGSRSCQAQVDGNELTRQVALLLCGRPRCGVLQQVSGALSRSARRRGERPRRSGEVQVGP
jgi:hypothetical protein